MTDARAAAGPARRKIAVIGLSYPYRGGISHYSTILVRELRKRHDTVFINFLRQYPGILFPGTTQYDYSAQTLNEPNERIIDSLNPWTWYRAARRLNREMPDLVVIQWWHPFFAPVVGMITRLLKPGLRKKVCFLCHNVYPHEGNPLQKFLARFAFGKSPYFIVHSGQDYAQLRALRPHATIRNGCHPTYASFGEDDGLSKDSAREKLGLAPGDRVVLYFGLVRAYKGVEYLVRAMPEIQQQIDCKLLVVGEFYDEKAPYLELIEAQGVADRVTVVDQYVPNEEVATYFRAADVVVLPYVSATQSGIVQIAFGLGTPVITTNVGGLPEAVDDGVTGFVVEPGNPGVLAEAVIKYYSGNFEQSFRAAIERQADRFDWDEELSLIEEFCDSGARAKS